jgi:hypothetical protein
VAGTLARQWSNKRLFGKPYLKGGQCFGLCGYLFELGGILAAKYAAKLDAFGPAFLGMSGAPGAMKTFCVEVANKLIAKNRVNEETTFLYFVQTEFASRMKHQGDPRDCCSAHMLDKIPVPTAAEFAWQCAENAVALGSIHPEIFRAMFDRTYAPQPKAMWDFAVASGLDIDREQKPKHYKDAEEAENKDFMEYCKEAHPQAYAILSAH